MSNFNYILDTLESKFLSNLELLLRLLGQGSEHGILSLNNKKEQTTRAPISYTGAAPPSHLVLKEEVVDQGSVFPTLRGKLMMIFGGWWMK